MAFAIPIDSIPSERSSGLPLFVVDSTPNTPIAAPSFKIATIARDNATIEPQISPVTTETMADGTIAITILNPQPENSSPTKIEILGTTYNLETNQSGDLITTVDLQPGNFTIATPTEIGNLVILINPLPQTESLPSIPTIRIVYQVNVSFSDEIFVSRLPDLFSRFPIYGTISLSRRFGDHPSASLQILADDRSVAAVESFFENNDRKIILYGIGFRTASINKTIRKLSGRETYEYNFSIQLEGFWKQLAEDNVKLNPSLNPVGIGITEAEDRPFSDDRCSLSNNNGEALLGLGGAPSSPLDQEKIRIYLSAIASRAGISYSGPGIFRDIPKDTSSEESTNFAAFISERASWFNSFPFWSNANLVEARSWSSSRSAGTFIGSQIIGDSPADPVQISINKAIEDIDLEPTEISWGYDKVENIDELEEESQQSQEPQFEYEPPEEYQITDPPDGSAKVPPINVSRLKTLSLNYDLSGPYEVETTTNYIGQNKLRETIDVYGFNYNSRDIISNGELNGDPATFWKLVDSRVVDYNYDPFTGYLTGANINGYQVRRFQTETEEALETIELEVSANSDPPDPTALNELATYNFVQSPTTGFNRKILAQIRDYFGATNGKRAKAKDKYIFFEKCGVDGRLRLRNKTNPNYVEPFFEAVNVDYFYNLNSTPNPDDTTIEDISGNQISRPPLTTGEERLNRSEIKVVETLNTPDDPPSKRLLPNSQTKVEKDFYLQRNLSYTARDAEFRNYKADSNSQLQEGTPSEAARIPRFYILSEDGSGEAKLPKRNRNVQPRTEERRYIVYSAGYNSNSAIVNSRDFPELTSLSQAIRAVRVEFEIASFLNQSSLTFKTNFAPSVQEGASILVIFGKFNFFGRVIGVDSENRVLGNTMTARKFSGSSTITVGFLTALPLFNYSFLDDLDQSSDDAESSDRGGDNLEGDDILDLFYKGKEIEGDPQYISVIQGIFNRGNL